MSDYAVNSFSRLFFRRNECEPFSFANCVTMDSVDVQLGETTKLYCPSSKKMDEFVVVETLQGSEETITTTISSIFSSDDFDVLEQLFYEKCSFDLLCVFGECNIPSELSQFSKIIAFKGARITSYSLTPLVAGGPDERDVVRQSASLNIESMYSFIKPNISATILQTDNRGPALDVTSICSTNDCVGSTECKSSFNNNTYITLHCHSDADCSQSDMMIRISNDSGVIWDDITLCCSNSSANSYIEYISPYVYIIIDDQLFIHLYSDLKNGICEPLVWENIDGSVLATFANQNGLVISTDNFTIYSVSESGVLTDLFAPSANNFSAIGGNGDVIIYGNAIGELYKNSTFTPINSPFTNTEISSILVETEEKFIVASCGDGVYRTCDGGVTWVKTSLPSRTSILVRADSIVYYAIANTATGSLIYVTVDGGFQWSELGDNPYLSNQINGVHLLAAASCQSNELIAVGVNETSNSCSYQPECNYDVEGVVVIGKV